MKSIGAITLFVDDPQRSKDVLHPCLRGRACSSRTTTLSAFRFDNLILNLLKRGAAVDELLGPVPPAASGASFELTVWVDDADAVCTELADRGVEIVTGPQDRPWGVRTATFLDPDGYVWEVAARSRGLSRG